MAKSYTIIEALAPANPNATLSGVVGGGSGIAYNTTYYYRIVGVGYNNYYYDTAYEMWLSVPSTEVSVTTDSTHRTVFLECDKLQSTRGGESEAFIVFRTTTSGDYAQTNTSGVSQKHAMLMEGGDSNTWLRLNVASKTQYRRYTFTSSASETFTIGETVTLSSGGTGIVCSGSGTSWNIYTYAGTWTVGATITGSVSGASAGTLATISAWNGYVMVDNRTTTASYQYTQPMFENGLPNILYDGSTVDDPVTPQDIYEYCQSVGRGELCEGSQIFDDGDVYTTNGYKMCTMFKMNCSIQDNSSQLNKWYQEGGTCVYWAGGKHALRGHSQRGEYDETTDKTGNGACEIVNSNYAWYPCLYYQEHKFYGSLLCGPTESFKAVNSTTDREPLYQWSGYPIIRDSCVKSTGRFNAEYVVKNSRIMIAGECGDPKNGAGVAATENASWDTYITQFYAQAESTFPNFILNERGTFCISLDTYYKSNSTAVMNMIDTTWSDSTYVTRNRGHANLPDAMVFDRYTLDLNLIDKDGNAISGATVTATDSNGVSAIFDKEWAANNYAHMGWTDTTMDVYQGALEIGKYYRVGDEIIYIVSGTQSALTILRGQFGSTPNKIGGASAGTNYMYEMYDDLTSDSNGNVSFLLLNRSLKHYSLAAGYTYSTFADMTTRGPYDITVKADGYETYTMKYTPDAKRILVVEMKDAVSVMTSTDSQVAVKLDPSNSGVNRDKVIIT